MRSCNRWSSVLVAALVSQVLNVRLVVAQSNTVRPEKQTLSVPDRVLFRPGADSEQLLMRDVHWTTEEERLAAMPRQVPVFTVFRAGQTVRFTVVSEAQPPRPIPFERYTLTVPLKPKPGRVLREANPRIVETETGAIMEGVYLENTQETRTLEQVPWRVSLSESGEYRIDTVHMDVPARISYIRPNSAQVPVLHEHVPVDQHLPQGERSERGPTWRMIMPLDPFFSGFLDPISQGQLLAVSNGVTARFETLMPLNAGDADLYLTFAFLDGPGGTLAESSGAKVHHPYSEVRSRLQLFAEGDSEDPVELTLYLNLPPGSAVLAYTNDVAQPQPEAFDRVFLPSSLAEKLLFSGGPDFDGDIILDVEDVLSLDFHIMSPPGSMSTEYILTHEACHLLGFRSAGGLLDPLYPFVLDLFRLQESLGPSVSINTFFNAPRLMNFSERPILVTGLSVVQRVYPLTTGNGAVAVEKGTHWRDAAAVVPPRWIGIMHRTPSIVLPGFFSLADLRALDTFGWNIDLSGVNAPPFMPMLLEPQDGAIDVPLTPTLTWEPGFSGTDSAVLIYRTDTPFLLPPELSVTGIVGGTLVVPMGSLRPGSVYSWVVVASNEQGVASSEAASFHTEGCATDWNVDTHVNSQDISAFLITWNVAVNDGTDDADFDADGATNSTDISVFLSAWLTDVNAGTCP